MDVIVKRRKPAKRKKPAYMSTWVSIEDNTAFVQLARAAGVKVGFAMEYALKRAMASLEFRRELAIYGQDKPTKATPRQVSFVLANRGRRYRATIGGQTDRRELGAGDRAGDLGCVERPRLYGRIESGGGSGGTTQSRPPIEAEARAA